MDFTLRDLLTFENLLFPRILRIVYLVGAALIGLSVLVGVLAALGAMRFSVGGGLAQILFALIGGAVGLLVWRIVCEMWLVAFGIYDRLGQIRDLIAEDEPPPR
jgi:hypothetical protein